MTTHRWHIEHHPRPFPHKGMLSHLTVWKCGRCDKTVHLEKGTCPDDSDQPHKNEDCDLVIARHVMES